MLRLVVTAMVAVSVFVLLHCLLKLYRGRVSVQSMDK